MTTFDPDRFGRENGEAHLIPPNVRRLTVAERHAMFPKEFHELHGDEECGCARPMGSLHVPEPKAKGRRLVVEL